jgi:hypothetical protein
MSKLEPNKSILLFPYFIRNYKLFSDNNLLKDIQNQLLENLPTISNNDLVSLLSAYSSID